MAESKHTPEQLLDLVKDAASEYGRCCNLYQDEFGTFHCHNCGQRTYAMLSNVQDLLGITKDIDHEEAMKIALRRRAAPELLEALVNICDGACWSLSGPRGHIAEIPSHKINKARAAIAETERI